MLRFHGFSLGRQPHAASFQRRCCQHAAPFALGCRQPSSHSNKAQLGQGVADRTSVRSRAEPSGAEGNGAEQDREQRQVLRQILEQLQLQNEQLHLQNEQLHLQREQLHSCTQVLSKLQGGVGALAELFARQSVIIAIGSGGLEYAEPCTLVTASSLASYFKRAFPAVGAEHFAALAAKLEEEKKTKLKEERAKMKAELDKEKAKLDKEKGTRS